MRFRGFIRALATALVSWNIAASAVAAPAAPASAAVAAEVRREGQNVAAATPSLAGSPRDALPPYRFVVKPRSEPTTAQLLLGGLLAVIFMIRNRFRQR